MLSHDILRLVFDWKIHGSRDKAVFMDLMMELVGLSQIGAVIHGNPRTQSSSHKPTLAAISIFSHANRVILISAHYYAGIARKVKKPEHVAGREGGQE